MKGIINGINYMMYNYWLLVMYRTTEASFLSFPLSKEQKHFHHRHYLFYIFFCILLKKNKEEKYTAAWPFLNLVCMFYLNMQTYFIIVKVC